jgi:serine/threonine-protein kinase
MGEVFLAEHVQLQKRVVVKLLHLSLIGFPKHVDRIRVEAEALGRLQHPSVVEVRDFGTTPEGRPYIVMERLLGETLQQEFRQKGALGAYEAVRYMRQVLAALTAAHELGIVHRDIKLDNIFIHQPAGAPRIVKVLDFGIAKIVDGVSSRAPQPLIPTDEGIVIGTPRFVSPEAALGKRVDHRADIYSVGLVLYTLLAGRGPWDDEKREGQLIMAQAMRVPEPPSAFATQPIPAELESIVMRALEKEPGKRFQSALEFDTALERFEAALQAPAGWLETKMFDPSVELQAVPVAKAAPFEQLDVHTTLIDERAGSERWLGEDTHSDFSAGKSAPEGPSLLTGELNEARNPTEVLEASAAEAGPTRTAQGRGDATDLRALEAKLRAPPRSPKTMLAGACAALVLVVLFGWWILR